MPKPYAERKNRRTKLDREPRVSNYEMLSELRRLTALHEFEEYVPVPNWMLYRLMLMVGNDG